jgi:hypothetical protein
MVYSLSNRLRHHLLEAINGLLQLWGKAAAVEAGGFATDLHAFDHVDIFVVGVFPEVDGQVAQGFVFGGHGLVANEVEGHALQGFAGAEGVDGEHQKVVGVNAQHQVGKDGDVFGDGFFVVGGQVGEVGRD